MTRLRLFPLCLAALIAAPSVSSAKTSDAVWAKARVQEKLVTPLAKRQGSRFSRSRPAPRERRIRVLSASAVQDKDGQAFLPFAVDVRFGEKWKDDIAGCVYKGSGNIYVKIGDTYRPAAFLLGKRSKPVRGACQAAPAPAKS